MPDFIFDAEETIDSSNDETLELDNDDDDDDDSYREYCTDCYNDIMYPDNF
jgi:hypothetical protein